MSDNIDIKTEVENVIKYGTLRKGDQLAVEGKKAGFKFYHHGIFISLEAGIIDFGANESGKSPVRQVDLAEFGSYGRTRIVRILYPDGDSLPPDVVARNAECVLQNPGNFGQYDVVTNNCEHFATLCKTGKHVSPQVISRLRKQLRNPKDVAAYIAIRCRCSSCYSNGSSRCGSNRDLEMETRV